MNLSLRLPMEIIFGRGRVLDPVLTYTKNPSLTASTGMDALTHAIESYTSKLANPITISLAGQAISLISKSLLHVVRNGSDDRARRNMLK